MPFWQSPPEHGDQGTRWNAPASFVACSEISHSSHGVPGEMKLSSRHGGAMPKSRLNTEMTKFSADRAAGDSGPPGTVGRNPPSPPAHRPLRPTLRGLRDEEKG